jgi:hypothetical protein
MEGPSVVAVDLDLEQFRCTKESRRYRAVFEQERLVEKENQSSSREKDRPSIVKDSVKKTKKLADPIKLLSGRPSRVRIQNELTSALKRANGKGKRRRKKKTQIVSKVVDPAKGVEQIKQLKQVYPFSTCCGAHCMPRNNDRLVDLAYYVQPQTQVQGLFERAAAVPDDLTDQDVMALHDNDAQWSIVDEAEAFWGYVPGPPGSASRRAPVKECRDTYGGGKEDGSASCRLEEAADESVEVIERKEILNGQQLDDRSEESDEMEDPKTLGCDLIDNMEDMRMIENSVIPDSQETDGAILVDDGCADDSVEVIYLSPGKRSGGSTPNQSSPGTRFQCYMEEGFNNNNRRLSIDSAFSLSSRQSKSALAPKHSENTNQTDDSAAENIDSPPELEESVNSSRDAQEASNVVHDSEAEDEIVLIPSSPTAETTGANDSVVIQAIEQNAPHTALVISDSEPDLDDMMSPPTTTKQPITHIADSEDESSLELRSPQPSNPQYESLTTKELRELIKQYGFKPVRTRSQMIQLLQSCHTQPTNLPPPTETANIRNHQLDEMLYQQIDENIKSHHDYTIYQQIISYEPIDILTLHSLITETFNFPINLDDTKSYCDLRGICFTTTNDVTNP